MKQALKMTYASARYTLVAAAASLSVTALATAQTPPAVSKTPIDLQEFQRATPAITVPLVGDSPRWSEVNVELAWLANPVSFAYQLEARTVGTALEISGEVRDEAGRQQVLQIARTESGMRVIDRLRVNPQLLLPQASRTDEILLRESTRTLRQALPQLAPRISVDLWSNGQVVLRGKVPTCEEKLALSRCLQRVAGCTCVINQVSVTGGSAIARHPAPVSPKPSVRRIEPPVALVQHRETAEANKAPSGSRTTVASPQVTSSLPPVQSIPVTPPEPATPRLLPQAAPTTAQNMPAAEPDLLHQAAAPSPVNQQNLSQPETPRVVPQPALLSAENLANAEHGASGKDATRPASYQTKWRRWADSATSAPRNEAAAVPEVEKRMAIAAPSPYLPTQSTAQPQIADRPAAPPMLLAATPSRQVYEAAPRALPAVSLQTPYALVPTLTDKKPAPMKNDSYVATGVVMFDVPAPPLPPPVERVVPERKEVVAQSPSKLSAKAYVDSSMRRVSYVEPAANSKKRPNIPGDNYVTSGVVTFDPPEPVVNPKRKPIQFRPHTPLERRIASACGKSVEAVEIKGQTEKTLVLRVKAKSTQEAERLSTLIFQMPELERFEVSLDIEVMP